MSEDYELKEKLGKACLDTVLEHAMYTGKMYAVESVRERYLLTRNCMTGDVEEYFCA
jgi:hypothetical protein